MSERDRILMSDDPKDLKWRFRVTKDASGLYVIAEEELTSAGPKAQPTEARAVITMTPRQAVWMAEALANLIATKKRA